MTNPKIDGRRGALKLVPLLMINALAVSSLYWAQSVVGLVTAELGSSAVVALTPGATLLGYALGVAAQAVLARDLSRTSGLVLHGACLSAAQCLTAIAPNIATIAIGYLAIGAGCSLTQRVIVIATTLVAPARQAQAIGMAIASGLVGIVIARACVADLATMIGWRTMFLAAAVTTFSACLAFAGLRSRSGVASGRLAELPSPIVLLRTVPALRVAATQQAVVFAGFNLGWALFPAASQASAGARAAIASAGAMAALLSGRACLTNPPRAVALLGLSSVVVAAGIAVLVVVTRMSASSPVTYGAMVLLELGTQVALVANQASAQAGAPSVPVRGRLAAIMTTIAFGGGAVGAVIGNLVQR